MEATNGSKHRGIQTNKLMWKEPQGRKETHLTF